MAMFKGGDVQLWKNKKEEELYDNLGDLYAIIKTTEKLERAYVRDAIPDQQYEAACEKLIGQFRTLWGSMREQVPDVEQFVADYHMMCPMAVTRLVKSGLPATIEHRKRATDATSGGRGGGARAVAEAVQHFITVMDTLKLNMAAVDQVCPILSDLVNSLAKIETLPPDFGPKEKVKAWYLKLYKMPASHELDADMVRQLLFELEAAYNEFMTHV